MGVSREKNDKIDSQKIGLYAYKNREDVKLWTPKREIMIELDRLTALRERLVKTIKVLKTPLSDAKEFVDKKMLDSEKLLCQSSIDALNKDLKSVDKKIKELIQNDPTLKELFEIIESVKGIGPVIATEVLITTNEFKDIDDPKKYACYSGFAWAAPLLLNIHLENTKESQKLVIKPTKKLRLYSIMGLCLQFSIVLK